MVQAVGQSGKRLGGGIGRTDLGTGDHLVRRPVVFARGVDRRPGALATAWRPVTPPAPRLAFLQGQRYWIERALQEGNQDVGLSDDQARGWQGWRQHLVLVMIVTGVLKK